MTLPPAADRSGVLKMGIFEGETFLFSCFAHHRERATFASDLYGPAIPPLIETFYTSYISHLIVRYMM